MLRTAAALGLAVGGCAAATELKTMTLIKPAAVVKASGDGTVTHGSVTMNVSDVPADAPAHYPWSSPEDFFRNSGLTFDDMTPSGVQKCTSPHPDAKVYQVSDGTQERCFVVIPPSSGATDAPFIFYAHGSGGSAYQCGDAKDLMGTSWVGLGQESGFGFVCGEAVQQQATNNITGQALTGGIWSLPEVFNDSGDRHCTNAEVEMAYLDAVFAKMATLPELDLSRTFFHGCSEGSAFTQWAAVCHHTAVPANVTAFATHSTGLKVKGDGNTLPPCPYDSSYTWGECPTCKYWPTVPGKFEGLKACIFDNTADPQQGNPLFYRTSEQMATYYKKFDSAYETHFGSGGHCEQHSYQAIAECMDDGTKRLMPGGSKPSPSPSPGGQCTDKAPSTDYTCAQQKELGKCDRPWMDGFCCQTCFACQPGCSN